MAKRAPKPKLGRPPLGDKARSATYLLKLTPDERATWQALADKQGITLAQLVRESVELSIVRGASR